MWPQYLPLDRMGHTAGAIAGVVTIYLALVGLIERFDDPRTARVSEDHPRQPHTFKGRMRMEQEDLVLAAVNEAQTRATAGVYFTFAKKPWGPWAEPQQIFNPRRDGALVSHRSAAV